MPAGPSPWRLASLVFLGWLALFAAALLPFEALFDADSYYHLAVARRYLEHGLGGGLEWTRLSVFAEGFGDKELLFHVLLMPFVALLPGINAGKAAIAALNASVATALTSLAFARVGRLALLLPVWLYLGSAELTLRLVRVRPEALSLLLLLLALELAARGRHRALGAVAFVYALTYTAFHAFLGLCFVWLLQEAWARRRSPDLVGYPLLGTTAGLLLHPHFPHNVHVWLLQNVELVHLALPDSGEEFQAASLRYLLHLNSGFVVGLALLGAASRRAGPEASTEEARRGSFALSAAIVFGLLVILTMPRFVTYFVPFAALALLLRPGWRLGRLPGRWGRTSSLVPALLLSLAPSLWAARETLRNAGVFSRVLEDGGRRFGAAVPSGARVAAPWDVTELFVFYAPQGRYLNVLDPVFLAAWRPQADSIQRAVFSGTEPDVPLAVGALLDSDHLAPGPGAGPLAARLVADPRLAALLEDPPVFKLFAVLPGRNAAFVLDWRVGPQEDVVPKSAEEIAAWPAYPLAESQSARALEGFVDAGRVGRPGCTSFARSFRLDAPLSARYELAPYGSAALWLDGRERVRVGGASLAVLGRGVEVPLDLTPGPHLLAVRTCPAAGRSGFYFLTR